MSSCVPVFSVSRCSVLSVMKLEYIYLANTPIIDYPGVVLMRVKNEHEQHLETSCEPLPELMGKIARRQHCTVMS